MSSVPQLTSEKVVVSAPMSLHGSASRIWKLTNTENPYVKWGLAVPSAVTLIALAWALIVCWYAQARDADAPGSSDCSWSRTGWSDAALVSADGCVAGPERLRGADASYSAGSAASAYFY